MPGGHGFRAAVFFHANEDQLVVSRKVDSVAIVNPPKQINKAPAQTERKPLPLGANARMNVRVVLALILFGLAAWTAAGFLPALIWATILAVALWPMYVTFSARLSFGSSSLAAFLFTAIVALILFTPMSLAVYQIAQQGDLLVGWLKQARESGVQVPDWVARLPVAAESLQSWWRANLSDPKAAAAWLQTVNADNASEFFKTLGGQLLHRLFLLLFSLLTLFFLLRDGATIATYCLKTSDRLIGDAGEGLVDKIVAATRGTVNGTVLVAVGEGLLIGVGYFVASVPNPVMFTILTTAFAMLPFGAWLAFTTAALVLISSGGSGFAAAAVFFWGAITMLAGDHFVWPTLVGDSARLPFLLAFVGIFGGLAAFGLFGLFLGPVIMAALLTVWREWIFRPVSQ
jgi:predicted PurR-regulated permease PerM